MISLILAALWGLVYGSFLNVLLWRLPEGRGINGRSGCRSCGHTLAWYDLIPIFSFLLLKGRCRYCKASIHPRYPIVELATSIVLALFVFVKHPIFDLQSIAEIAGILIFVSLFFFDLFYFILPDVITIPAIIVYATIDLFFTPNPILHLAVGLLMALFFAILYKVSKGRQLGFGDVKLALLVGLVLGYPLGFIAIVSGIWLGALTGLMLMVGGLATRKDALPLGAFLSLTSIIVIIFSHATLIFFGRFF